MSSNVKTAVFWVVIIMVVVLLWTVVRQTKSHPDDQPSFSTFMKNVEEGKVILQGEVLFDSGSDRLRVEGRSFLEGLAR